MEPQNKFEKVSFKEFSKSINVEVPKDELREIYDAIKLPKRAAAGSAGCDFYAPYGFTLHPGATEKIPTGINVKLKNNRFLAILPRSGLGFKYRLRLDNTIGIIDSDYYDSDNEGHIFIKMTNESTTDKAVSIERGWHLPRELFFRLKLYRMMRQLKKGTAALGAQRNDKLS